MNDNSGFSAHIDAARAMNPQVNHRHSTKISDLGLSWGDRVIL
jgi:hypothetical protein